MHRQQIRTPLDVKQSVLVNGVLCRRVWPPLQPTSILICILIFPAVITFVQHFTLSVQAYLLFSSSLVLRFQQKSVAACRLHMMANLGGIRPVTVNECSAAQLAIGSLLNYAFSRACPLTEYSTAGPIINGEEDPQLSNDQSWSAS